jgi:glycosyltransferase involved in cell wall biosynthesis
MRSEIENAIRSAALERQFIFAGWGTGDRVKAEILGSRALILPSFSENMPIVIMEAMALGRPVISTYVAGIPELVKPDETGWLVPASDEAALAEAIRDCLAISGDQIARMGNAAKRHVADHHDTLKEAGKLKDLFANAIATRKQQRKT